MTMLNGKILRKIGLAVKRASDEYDRYSIDLMSYNGTVYASTTVVGTDVMAIVGRASIEPVVIPSASIATKLPDSVEITSRNGVYKIGRVKLATEPLGILIPQSVIPEWIPEMKVFPYFGWIERAIEACNRSRKQHDGFAAFDRNDEGEWTITVSGPYGFATRNVGQGEYYKFACPHYIPAFVRAITDYMELIVLARRGGGVYVRGKHGMLRFENYDAKDERLPDKGTPIAGAVVKKTELRRGVRMSGMITELKFDENARIVADVYPSQVCGSGTCRVNARQLLRALECLNGRSIGLTLYSRFVELSTDRERVTIDRVVA